MTTATAPEPTIEVLPPTGLEPVRYDVAESTIAKWRDEFTALTIAGIDDKDGLALVHEKRMLVKNTRVAIEKTRVGLKAKALEYGRTVDGEAKRLTSLLAPIERHLMDEESRIEDEKNRIKCEAEEARRVAIQARVDAFFAVDLMVAYAAAEAMSEEVYAAKLADATEAHRKEEDRRTAEAAERQRLQAEEDARRKAEADRLAAERAELDRQRAEQEAIRKQQEEAAAKLEAERKAIEDAKAAEAQRIADAKAAEDRAAELERAKAEAAERARVETEQRIEREAAEAKAKAAAEEAARKRAEAERPIREKIVAFSKLLTAMDLDALPADPVWIRQRARKILHGASIEIASLADELELIVAAVEESEL